MKVPGAALEHALTPASNLSVTACFAGCMGLLEEPLTKRQVCRWTSLYVLSFSFSPAGRAAPLAGPSGFAGLHGSGPKLGPRKDCLRGGDFIYHKTQDHWGLGPHTVAMQPLLTGLATQQALAPPLGTCQGCPPPTSASFQLPPLPSRRRDQFHTAGMEEGRHFPLDLGPWLHREERATWEETHPLHGAWKTPCTALHSVSRAGCAGTHWDSAHAFPYPHWGQMGCQAGGTFC